MLHSPAAPAARSRLNRHWYANNYGGRLYKLLFGFYIYIFMEPTKEICLMMT